jgi:hypothetical protein
MKDHLNRLAAFARSPLAASGPATTHQALFFNNGLNPTDVMSVWQVGGAARAAGAGHAATPAQGGGRLAAARAPPPAPVGTHAPRLLSTRCFIIVSLLMSPLLGHRHKTESCACCRLYYLDRAVKVLLAALVIRQLLKCKFIHRYLYKSAISIINYLYTFICNVSGNTVRLIILFINLHKIF